MNKIFPGAPGLLRSAPRVCGLAVLVGLVSAGPSSVADSLTLGGFAAPPVVEEKVEEKVEEQVEEALEEQVADTVSEQVEEQVIDQVEDQVDESLLTLGGFVEAKVEEQVEEQVEEALEEEVQEVLENVIEDAVADNVAEDVEERVEESVEDAVQDVVEDALESTVEDSVEQVVENSVEDTVEDSVEDSVEDAVEETVEEQVASTVEDSLEEGVEQGLEQGLEQEVEVQVVSAVEEQLESEIDEILEGIESDLEIDEGRIHKDQWLVMAEPEVFDRLAEEGYLFATVTDLPGMGMRLAEVAAPSSFDITEVRQGVIDVVGKERAEVDLNHIYTAGEPVNKSDAQAPIADAISPRAAISFPADIDQMSLRIGMIDSQVDVSHPSLDSARIESRTFAPEGAELPDFHGTAIASIIAADDGEYVGLAPQAEVYAAAVFEKDQERGEIASTVSLVRALDWLMTSGVDVVNISLAGPPNRLLEAALGRAQERGVMILAAAGNGGPMAKPMYPAAYDSVVAVTAVDKGGRVFRLANRGDYLDLAAPGVSLLHARAGGGYSASSGTSFAVPFAATAAARLRKVQPGSDVLEVLYSSAQDLGPPGRDEIYGYGLLRPAS
jgi:hypothetical protein